jgi:hypothetical protein
MQARAGECDKQSAALAQAEFGKIDLGDHHRVSGLAHEPEYGVHQQVTIAPTRITVGAGGGIKVRGTSRLASDNYVDRRVARAGSLKKQSKN